MSFNLISLPLAVALRSSRVNGWERIQKRVEAEGWSKLGGQRQQAPHQNTHHRAQLPHHRMFERSNKTDNNYFIGVVLSTSQSPWPHLIFQAIVRPSFLFLSIPTPSTQFHNLKPHLVKRYTLQHHWWNKEKKIFRPHKNIRKMVSMFRLLKE